MFGTAFFDALLLSSDAFTPQHRKLEGLWEAKPKDIVAVGCPYMDRLLVRYQADTQVVGSKTIRVLVAPTWGANSLFNLLGNEFLDSLVATGFDITFRPHPQSYISESELLDRLKEQYPESERLHWDNATDNYESLKQSDILISDYSGVIYDYAFIFERPVLYTPAPDNVSTTDYSLINEPSWNADVLPQIGRLLSKQDFGNLKVIITEMVSAEQSKEHIREARDRCWQNRGHAAETVVDYLIRKSREFQ
jgi:CDP-glycerol glycerophosphotransferase (TagB/SpsB family)